MKKLLIYNAWSLNSGYGTGVAVAFNHIINGIKKKKLNFAILTSNYQFNTFLGFILKRILNNLIITFKINKIKPNVLLGIDLDGFLVNEKKIKYILNLRTNFSEIKIYESGLMKVSCLIEEWAQKIAVSKARLIIVASKYTKNAVIKNYGVEANKIKIVPNGIDNKTYFISCPNVPNENLILGVSAIYPRKGLGILLKSLEILKEKNIQFKYIHIGGGPLERKIKKVIKKLGLEANVTMLGRVSSREEIASFYKKCKVFCHPCLQEDFGNVFLEAMAFGKPIVTFNNSVTGEFITNGKNGFLVKNREVNHLAECLKILLEDDKLCYSMGKENLKRIKKYSWNKTTNGFIALINEIQNEK